MQLSILPLSYSCELIFCIRNYFRYFSYSLISMSMNFSGSHLILSYHDGSRTLNLYPRMGLHDLYLEIAVVKMVEDIGVEPMTSCVQGRRSSQLS